MRKGINLVFDEHDLIELLRILLDEDEEGALDFLKAHFRGKVRELLDGG